jgi:hypothetical protein
MFVKNSSVSNLEQELFNSLNVELSKEKNIKEAFNMLVFAANNLDQLDLIKEAEEVTQVLQSLKQATISNDPATENLNDHKMEENLINVGWVFNPPGNMAPKINESAPENDQLIEVSEDDLIV